MTGHLSMPSSLPTDQPVPEPSRPSGDRPSGSRASGNRPPGNRALWFLGAATTALLVLVSARYGYHRDELYFLAAGRHLAWGYPDQPPLTPMLARLMSTLAPDSLVVLRLPSAAIAGLVVVLTGHIARRLDAGPTAQLLAATCMAVAGGTLAITHTLGTSSLDLLFWTLLTLLVVRLLRGADARWWLAVGAVLGLALENKALVAFFAIALLMGLAISGPRRLLRSGWLWTGALLALAIWTPNLLWQAGHGWPQLTLSQAIADGGSTSSQPWYQFVPMELLLMGPVLVPIWLTGILRLFGARMGLPRVRTFAAFGWAWVLLFVFFVLTGGKPYYLIGLYPLLFAAGAEPTMSWVRRGHGRLRSIFLTSAVVLSLLVDSTISLPLLPVRWLQPSPVLAMNPDAGETVGWPAFVDTVASVYHRAPAGAVVLTGNYGEAGAIDHYGSASGLPSAFSGHNGYGLWGPPSDSSTDSAVVVGLERAQLVQWFSSVTPEARVDDGVGLDNQEQGRTVWLCTGQRTPWSQIWPSLERLG